MTPGQGARGLYDDVNPYRCPECDDPILVDKFSGEAECPNCGWSLDNTGIQNQYGGVSPYGGQPTAEYLRDHQSAKYDELDPVQQAEEEEGDVDKALKGQELPKIPPIPKAPKPPAPYKEKMPKVPKLPKVPKVPQMIGKVADYDGEPHGPGHDFLDFIGQELGDPLPKGLDHLIEQYKDTTGKGVSKDEIKDAWGHSGMGGEYHHSMRKKAVVGDQEHPDGGAGWNGEGHRDTVNPSFTTDPTGEIHMPGDKNARRNGERKNANWKFDIAKQCFIADREGDFACPSCSTSHTKLGFITCTCGKAWNSWVVRPYEGDRTSSTQKYYCREVHLEDGMAILGAKGSTPKPNQASRTAMLNPGVNLTKQAEDYPARDTWHDQDLDEDQGKKPSLWDKIEQAGDNQPGDQQKNSKQEQEARQAERAAKRNRARTRTYRGEDDAMEGYLEAQDAEATQHPEDPAPTKDDYDEGKAEQTRERRQSKTAGDYEQDHPLPPSMQDESDDYNAGYDEGAVAYEEKTDPHEILDSVDPNALGADAWSAGFLAGYGDAYDADGPSATLSRRTANPDEFRDGYRDGLAKGEAGADPSNTNAGEAAFPAEKNVGYPKGDAPTTDGNPKDWGYDEGFKGGMADGSSGLFMPRRKNAPDATSTRIAKPVFDTNMDGKVTDPDFEDNLLELVQDALAEIALRYRESDMRHEEPDTSHYQKKLQKIFDQVQKMRDGDTSEPDDSVDDSTETADDTPSERQSNRRTRRGPYDGRAGSQRRVAIDYTKRPSTGDDATDYYLWGRDSGQDAASKGEHTNSSIWPVGDDLKGLQGPNSGILQHYWVGFEHGAYPQKQSRRHRGRSSYPGDWADLDSLDHDEDPPIGQEDPHADFDPENPNQRTKGWPHAQIDPISGEWHYPASRTATDIDDQNVDPNTGQWVDGPRPKEQAGNGDVDHQKVDPTTGQWVSSRRAHAVRDEKAFVLGWNAAEAGRDFSYRAARPFLEGYIACLETLGYDTPNEDQVIQKNFVPHRKNIPNSTDDLVDGGPGQDATPEERAGYQEREDRQDNAPRDETRMMDNPGAHGDEHTFLGYRRYARGPEGLDAPSEAREDDPVVDFINNFLPGMGDGGVPENIQSLLDDFNSLDPKPNPPVTADEVSDYLGHTSRRRVAVDHRDIYPEDVSPPPGDESDDFMAGHAWAAAHVGDPGWDKAGISHPGNVGEAAGDSDPKEFARGVKHVTDQIPDSWGDGTGVRNSRRRTAVDADNNGAGYDVGYEMGKSGRPYEMGEDEQAAQDIEDGLMDDDPGYHSPYNDSMDEYYKNKQRGYQDAKKEHHSRRRIRAYWLSEESGGPICPNCGHAYDTNETEADADYSRGGGSDPNGCPACGTVNDFQSTQPEGVVERDGTKTKW